jgi:hypothetical protein
VDRLCLLERQRRGLADGPRALGPAARAGGCARSLGGGRRRRGRARGPAPDRGGRPRPASPRPLGPPPGGHEHEDLLGPDRGGGGGARGGPGPGGAAPPAGRPQGERLLRGGGGGGLRGVHLRLHAGVPAVAVEDDGWRLHARRGRRAPPRRERRPLRGLEAGGRGGAVLRGAERARPRACADAPARG